MPYRNACVCATTLGDFAVFQGRLTSPETLNTNRYGLASQIILPGTSIDSVGDRGCGWSSMRGASNSYMVYFPSSTDTGTTKKYSRATDVVTSLSNLPITGYGTANPHAGGMAIGLGKGALIGAVAGVLTTLGYVSATDTSAAVGTMIRGTGAALQTTAYTTSLATSGNLYQVGSCYGADVIGLNVSSWSFGTNTYTAQQATLSNFRGNAGGIAGTIYGYVFGGTQGWQYSGVWYSDSLRFTYDTNSLVGFTSLAGTRSFSWGVSGAQTGTQAGVINTPYPSGWGSDVTVSYNLNLSTEALTQSSIIALSTGASYWCGA